MSIQSDLIAPAVVGGYLCVTTKINECATSVSNRLLGRQVTEGLNAISRARSRWINIETVLGYETTLWTAYVLYLEAEQDAETDKPEDSLILYFLATMVANIAWFTVFTYNGLYVLLLEKLKKTLNVLPFTNGETALLAIHREIERAEEAERSYTVFSQGSIYKYSFALFLIVALYKLQGELLRQFDNESGMHYAYETNDVWDNVEVSLGAIVWGAIFTNLLSLGMRSVNTAYNVASMAGIKKSN